MRRSNVVIGMLGTQLDIGGGPKRWERWRPTVDLCRHDDFVVDRLVLIHNRDSLRLVDEVIADIDAASPETKVEPVLLELADPWDFEEVFARLHEFAQGFAFVPESEEYFVHITTGTHVAQICLFLLTEARYLPGRLLQTSPPPANLKGNPGSYSIIDLDLSRYDKIASRFRIEHQSAQARLKLGIETRDANYNRLIARIEEVASVSTAPILLLGPTGSGKSQLAKRIHALKSERRKLSGAFVELNCATVRGESASSMLFGHTKGSYTGALSAREGLLRRADGGVLFLDEIGELGLDEQAMLLRAIEERCFYPLGSDREVRSEFELICGTNRDLPRLAAKGRFRADLLARINLWTFRLPALIERLDDLEPNLEYELAEAARRLGRQVAMSREAREQYLTFASSSEATWPGNFRDLNASVTRMATLAISLATSGRITEELVHEEIVRLRAAFSAEVEPGEAKRSRVVRLLGEQGAAGLDRFDVAQLEDVLAVCERVPTLSAAGRILFQVSRTEKSTPNDADRLRKYLARFGLTFSDAGRLLAPSGRPPKAAGKHAG